MKVKTAVTSLKVEKGCVNMNCEYCTEKGKCNLETILTLLKQIFEICKEDEFDCIGECGNYNPTTRILEIKEIKEILNEVNYGNKNDK